MSELPNDEIDLVELFQIIWDGKWLIAGLSALIIAPAFAFLAFIYEPGKKASINDDIFTLISFILYPFPL